MADIIQFLNGTSSKWLDLIIKNSVQIALLVILITVISSLIRNKSALFLYSLWLVVLLKAIIIPRFQFPFPFNPISPDQVYIYKQLAVASSGELPGISIATLLFIAWIAGMGIILILKVRTERKFAGIYAAAEKFESGRLLTDLQEKIGIKRPVRVLISHTVPAPFSRGIKRSAIYLPSAAHDWKPRQLQHVLSHELVHIKRRDILLIYLQNFVTLIYFFNPFVWLANAQLNFHREKLCDDLAVSLLEENPRDYGRTLVDNLESFIVRKRAPLMANGLFFSKATIIKRFEYLLKRGKVIDMNLNIIQKSALISLGIFVMILSCDFDSRETTTEAVNPPEALSTEEDLKFVPYDQPPEPIGGFQAIQNRVIYPLDEEELGHEGTVIIQAYIDPEGDVTKAKVLRSSGFEKLDQAGLEAIRQSRFSPAMQKEQAVGVYISIPVVFKLNNDIKENSGKRISMKAGEEKAPASTKFIPYDSPPKPVNGQAGILDNLKIPGELEGSELQGTTLVQVYIDKNGMAQNSSVKKSCGNKILDRAAVAAIEKTAFIPGKQRDKNIGVWIIIPMEFRI